VWDTWHKYPVVSARCTGEEETMQWIATNEQDMEYGGMGWGSE